jgi:hypothetical protein
MTLGFLSGCSRGSRCSSPRVALVDLNKIVLEAGREREMMSKQG